MWRRIVKFLKTPKGLVTIILAFLILLATPPGGGRHTMAALARATLAAGLLDALILRVRKKAWEYPSGAVLSAAIVVMVLRWQEPWYVTTVTSVIAILGKYLFRAQANVFNPAALAMVAGYYLFHAGQSWWGSGAEVESGVFLILMATGIFITNRVNKMPLVLVFLGAYFALFTVTAFVGDPLPVAEIFRIPDLGAVFYFAFFILTDPPTSPVRYRDQIWCGLIVAVVSWACFELTGVVYYLFAGVLAGNVWEAWRRTSRRAGSRDLAGFLRDIAPWPARPAH